ncbi:MAG: hypothetical protein HC857_17660 [Synechococcales cyanobacterium RU_4_20]|nr:hypothetical protein [Synechococcales cyanobacterium RU_4_20]
MLDDQRLIHLTEISAVDLPTRERYKYKCRVQFTSEQGATLAQRDLFARMQPNWLVELKNKGDCTIAITFCFREGDIGQPWQDIGTVEFDTQTYLNGDRNAELEFPIATWEQAPQLKLKTRLTQSAGEGGSSAVTVFSRQVGAQQVRGRTNGKDAPEVELPPDIPLTPPEEVIVKDVWNSSGLGKNFRWKSFSSGCCWRNRS